MCKLLMNVFLGLLVAVVFAQAYEEVIAIAANLNTGLFYSVNKTHVILIVERAPTLSACSKRVIDGITTILLFGLVRFLKKRGNQTWYFVLSYNLYIFSTTLFSFAYYIHHVIGSIVGAFIVSILFWNYGYFDRAVTVTNLRRRNQFQWFVKIYVVMGFLQFSKIPLTFLFEDYKTSTKAWEAFIEFILIFAVSSLSQAWKQSVDVPPVLPY